MNVTGPVTEIVPVLIFLTTPAPDPASFAAALADTVMAPTNVQFEEGEFTMVAVGVVPAAQLRVTKPLKTALDGPPAVVEIPPPVVGNVMVGIVAGKVTVPAV